MAQETKLGYLNLLKVQALIWELTKNLESLKKNYDKCMKEILVKIIVLVNVKLNMLRCTGSGVLGS